MPDLSRSRAPRVPFVRLLQVLPVTGSHTPRRLWAQNVSMGGAFIRAAEPLPVGARVRISFSTPDGRIVQLGEARVCWRRTTATVPEPSGFGVQFIHLDDSARQVLQDIVRKGPHSISDAGRRMAAAAQVEPPLRAPGYRPPLVPPPPSMQVDAEHEEDDARFEGGKVLPFHKTA